MDCMAQSCNALKWVRPNYFSRQPVMGESFRRKREASRRLHEVDHARNVWLKAWRIRIKVCRHWENKEYPHTGTSDISCLRIKRAVAGVAVELPIGKKRLNRRIRQSRRNRTKWLAARCPRR